MRLFGNLRDTSRTVVFAASLVSSAIIAGTAVADSLTYRNDRFGTSIQFPTTLFDTLAPPPANGDGQTFLGRDQAQLVVYATQSGDLNAMAAAARQELEEVTLDRVDATWFAISGFTAEGDVIYQRTERASSGVFHTAILNYPPSQKERIDPQVGRIMNTLDGR